MIPWWRWRIRLEWVPRDLWGEDGWAEAFDTIGGPHVRVGWVELYVGIYELYPLRSERFQLLGIESVPVLTHTDSGPNIVRKLRRWAARADR